MIVKRALEAPIRQIVETVKLSTAPTRGYDAATMDYVDMLQAGIIDPWLQARLPSLRIPAIVIGQSGRS